MDSSGPAALIYREMTRSVTSLSPSSHASGRQTCSLCQTWSFSLWLFVQHLPLARLFCGATAGAGCSLVPREASWRHQVLQDVEAPSRCCRLDSWRHPQSTEERVDVERERRGLLLLWLVLRRPGQWRQRRGSGEQAVGREGWGRATGGRGQVAGEGGRGGRVAGAWGGRGVRRAGASRRGGLVGGRRGRASWRRGQVGGALAVAAAASSTGISWGASAAGRVGRRLAAPGLLAAGRSLATRWGRVGPSPATAHVPAPAPPVGRWRSGQVWLVRVVGLAHRWWRRRAGPWRVVVGRRSWGLVRRRRLVGQRGGPVLPVRVGRAVVQQGREVGVAALAREDEAHLVVGPALRLAPHHVERLGAPLGDELHHAVDVRLLLVRQHVRLGVVVVAMVVAMVVAVVVWRRLVVVMVAVRVLVRCVVPAWRPVPMVLVVVMMRLLVVMVAGGAVCWWRREACRWRRDHGVGPAASRRRRPEAVVGRGKHPRVGRRGGPRGADLHRVVRRDRGRARAGAAEGAGRALDGDDALQVARPVLLLHTAAQTDSSRTAG